MGKGWEAAECSVKTKLGPPAQVQRRQALGAAAHSEDQTKPWVDAVPLSFSGWSLLPSACILSSGPSPWRFRAYWCRPPPSLPHATFKPPSSYQRATLMRPTCVPQAPHMRPTCIPHATPKPPTSFQWAAGSWKTGGGRRRTDGGGRTAEGGKGDVKSEDRKPKSEGNPKTQSTTKASGTEDTAGGPAFRITHAWWCGKARGPS